MDQENNQGEKVGTVWPNTQNSEFVLKQRIDIYSTGSKDIFFILDMVVWHKIYFLLCVICPERKLKPTNFQNIGL